MNPTQPTKTYSAHKYGKLQFPREEARRLYFMRAFDQNWQRVIFSLPHNRNHPFTAKPGNGNQIRKVTL